MLYRFADLILESEVPFSELPPIPSGTAECRVRFDLPTERPSSDDRWDHHWRSPDGSISLSCSRLGDSYRLGIPGLATIAIDDDGRTITLRPHGDLPASTVEHLLIDQVLPRVLTHRGRLVLHAGCVATPRGAIAFLGDSGVGKSTLCGEFARAGHPLLGDDGIAVARASSGFEATATYPGLRLLPDPFAMLFHARSAASTVAHYSTKRRVGRDDSGLALASGPEPLRAFYVLEHGSAIEIAPLPDREAFLALVRSAFLLHLDDQERSRELFDRIGALKDSVPVRRLAYPRDLALLGSVRGALLADPALYLEPAIASAS